MQRLSKYSGKLLLWTGVLHIVVGLIISKDAWSQIISDGFINAVGQNFERGFALWFLLCGVMFSILGYTLDLYIKKEQEPAPLALGYILLTLAIVVCLILPISGAWLFIPQAVIIICANKNRK